MESYGAPATSKLKTKLFRLLDGAGLGDFPVAWPGPFLVVYETVNPERHARYFRIPLLEFGDEAALKAKGRLRVEGKAYIIQDGDVVNYLFNV